MVGTQGTATLKGGDQGLGARSLFEVVLGELNVLIGMDIGDEILITILSLVVGDLDLVCLDPSRHVFAELFRTFREFRVQRMLHVYPKLDPFIPFNFKSIKGSS
jgi:hypothetical protein